MTTTTQKVFDQLSVIFAATEEVLTEWTGEGNLQFPALMASLSTKLAWTDRQVRENDPIVRFYVRNSEDWCITRGARGGITRTADKLKKLEALSAKEALKKQMKQKIEQQAATQSDDSLDSDDLEEDQF